jgi:hypothetical protein
MNGDEKAIVLASHSISEMIQTLYFSSRIGHLAFIGWGVCVCLYIYISIYIYIPLHF